MSALRIDFAPPSWRRAGVRVLLAFALGLLACALAAGCLWHLRADVQRRQEAVSALRARQAARAQRPVVAPAVIAPARRQAVNRAIAELNLPWRDLWDAIAIGTPDDVAILSLDPDARSRVLRVAAEAHDAAAMLAYVAQLKRQPMFATVVLTKHERVEQDPQRPLRFQFEARWTEAAP